MSDVLLISSIALLLLALSIVMIKRVPAGRVGLVERMGDYQAPPRPAGILIVMPFIDRIHLVDIQEQVLTLVNEPVLTRDHSTVKIRSVLAYVVSDPVEAHYEFRNNTGGIRELLGQALSDRVYETNWMDLNDAPLPAISKDIQEVLAPKLKKWGLSINRFEIKSIGKV